MSRKALLVVALAATMTGRSYAGVFADVPFDHWAYSAVEQLAQVGVLEGYPDGTFKGPQPLTRYEFAVAIARAYDWIRKGISAPGAGTDELVQKLFDRIAADPRFKPGVGKDGQNGRDGAAGKDGKDGKDGIPGVAGRDGRDGKDGVAGRDGKDGRDGRDIPADALRRIDDLAKLIDAFRPELAALGRDVTAMRQTINGIEQRVKALEANVTDHEGRIKKLERLQVTGSMYLGMGLDGSPSKSGARDGDLRIETGEGYTTLSGKVGLDWAINDAMKARATFMYDTDDNPFHGASARRKAGLSQIGIDEMWVKTPGLGGNWIFGRQYAGQDYATGAAKCGLGLGTGYYTGAALNGIRAQYPLGKRIGITVLAQAQDNSSAAGANIAGVARADISLPWLKDKAGKSGVGIGLMGVKALASRPTATTTLLTEFNQGEPSAEATASADLYINFLKGLRVEYTQLIRNRFDQVAKTGSVVYGKLGVLHTPTFELDVAGAWVQSSFAGNFSAITNPYVRTASAVDALVSRPILFGAPAANDGTPSQGVDANLKWRLSNRPLSLRFASSTRKADTFNWLAAGSVPLLQTGAGNVNLGAAYVNVDKTHPLGGNTVAVNLGAGFGF
jgi:hypothetical protein